MLSFPAVSRDPGHKRLLSVPHICLHDFDRSADCPQAVSSHAFRHNKCFRVMHLIGSETSVHTLHKASCSIDQIEDIYALMAVELRAVLNGESSRLNEFQFVQAGVFLHKVLRS